MAELLVRDIFRNAAAAVPGRIAAVHEGGRITFGDLHRRGTAVAATLAGRGVGRGDRVVVWGGTTLDQVPVFVALAELGAAFAPVSGLLGVDEAAALAEPLRPALLLTDGARSAGGRALAARLGIDTLDITGWATAAGGPAGHVAPPLATPASAGGPPGHPVHPGDPAVSTPPGDGHAGGVTPAMVGQESPPPSDRAGAGDRSGTGDAHGRGGGVTPAMGGQGSPPPSDRPGVGGGSGDGDAGGVGAAFVAPELDERDAHAIFFTSGSTGRSKGVELSNRVSWLRSHPGALLEPRGPFVCPYPMFHMAVWTQALQQWHARQAIVFTTGDAAEICTAITEHRAERINAIPGVWRRILAHVASPAGADAGHDLGSLRYADTGTSATPPDLLAALRELLPDAAIRVFYGSTETGAATMLEDADLERKPGSAGTVAPFAEIRLAADGELQVRGPQVFEGYHGDPEATAAAFTADGWYRTGDLAEVDGEGYVTIVGRTGDLIRTGGEAVAPGEVEAVLAEHPGVAEVAVVGLPDEAWGQLVCAVVVPAGGAGDREGDGGRGAAPTIEDLVAHCDGRLARYKRPRRVVLVDELPRTASTGQVQRRRLVDVLKQRSGN